jgi:hypothetical protein
MKHNRLAWGIVSLIVLLTMAISFGPSLTRSQPKNPKQQDLTKYPIVDFDEPEPSEALERERKKEKDKRYDRKSFLVQRPLPDYTRSALYDYEAEPKFAFPFNQSKLVISGLITGSKAVVSSAKTSVYSEYTIQIENIFKQTGGPELQVGQTVIADRLGGRVRYPNGAVMLYRIDWQDLPETNGRYLFFLDCEEGKNPNYKIVTAYEFTEENVNALDAGVFGKHNGRKQSDFIKLVKEAAKGQ